MSIQPKRHLQSQRKVIGYPRDHFANAIEFGTTSFTVRTERVKQRSLIPWFVRQWVLPVWTGEVSYFSDSRHLC
jgi:hypothetical protein